MILKKNMAAQLETCFSASLLLYFGFENKSVQGTVSRIYVNDFRVNLIKIKLFAFSFFCLPSFCGLGWRQGVSECFDHAELGKT